MNKTALVLGMLAALSLSCEIELVTPTPHPPIKTGPPTLTAMTMASPTEMLADMEESSPTPAASVTVTRETVNLRDAKHAAAGSVVKFGEMLAVICGTDGYCEILQGPHAGLYIWRGCTSDPAGLGCEAK